MELWMRVGDGELTNVGTFDGCSTDEVRGALADLLIACAEAVRAGAPVVGADHPDRAGAG